MRILALDLGKGKSVACDYDTAAATHEFETIRTTPRDVHDLLARRRPGRLVVEVCGASGWVVDLCRTLGVDVQVANPTHDAWRWKNVRKKTDRTDALKLAQLSAAGQLPTVYVPSPAVRQWRGLIAYRQRLVRERTRVKNAIRALLHGQGLDASLPSAKKGWTQASVAQLATLGRRLEDADATAATQLWRGQLDVELTRLGQVTGLIDRVTARLDAVGAADERVGLLRSIPGVGPRLAEVVVATIDDPHRFESAKQVGAYAGLTPRVFQSGQTDRKGRISCQGNPLLRALLVEVGWLGRQHNPWLKALHERLTRGGAARKKVAIVAVARRLLVVCWAMLRDGTRWREPAPALIAAATPA